MGHIDSLELEFTRLRRTLLSRALRITKHEADAEDVVQAAFLRACEQALCPEQQICWRSWLSTVVRRLAIDVARRRARTSLGVDPDDIEHVEPEPRAAWADLSDEHVQTAARACRPRSLLIYELYYNQRLSYRQIGEQLQITQSTVAARIRRARLSIRAQLEGVLLMPRAPGAQRS